MQAKPSSYQGVSFRSKTEIKWAKLINNLGFDFEYEPEHILTTLGWYVPDFKLKGLWVEVKGCRATPSEVRKAKDVSIKTKMPVVIVCGFPDFYINKIDDHMANSHLIFIVGNVEVKIPCDELFQLLAQADKKESLMLGSYVNSLKELYTPMTFSDYYHSKDLKPRKAEIKSDDPKFKEVGTSLKTFFKEATKRLSKYDR